MFAQAHGSFWRADPRWCSTQTPVTTRYKDSPNELRIGKAHPVEAARGGTRRRFGRRLAEYRQSSFKQILVRGCYLGV